MRCAIYVRASTNNQTVEKRLLEQLQQYIHKWDNGLFARFKIKEDSGDPDIQKKHIELTN